MDQNSQGSYRQVMRMSELTKLPKQYPQVGQNNMNSMDMGVDIVFKNLSYSVEVPKKEQTSVLPCKKEMEQKQILKNVTGIFKPKEISAIIGSSGAGKTTLLNLLACRIPKKEGGELLANKTPYSYATFGDFANYVMQSDVLMQTLTVRQTLQFAANLKLNESTEVKQQRVKELCNRLKLEKCLDVLVGGFLIKGVSGGQKKRTSIAFELISDPKVVMLDEPTSGLDSLTSYIIVDYLAKLAHNGGKTIIMTIHQPNSEIFNLFDKLMLLVAGRAIYQGPANKAVQYFGNNFGLWCPQFHNPADYFMGIMHQQNPQNVNRFPSYFDKYDKSLTRQIQAQIALSNTSEIVHREVIVPLSTTFSSLLKRDFLNTIRNPMLIKSRLIQTLFLALFAGGVFFNAGRFIPNSASVPQWFALVGFFFFISMTSFMSSLAPVTLVFPTQREIFLKQEGARMYSVIPYFLSRNAIQIPYLVLFPLLFDLVIYWMVGLASTPQQFFIFYLISFLVSFAGNSLGLLIGSLSSDPKQVSAIIPVLLVPFILFSGFFKNRNNLPVWLGWMEYISPIKYSFSAFTINQITQNNAVLTTLGFDFDMWPAIGMLIALTVFYRVFSLFFLWLLRTKLE